MGLDFEAQRLMLGLAVISMLWFDPLAPDSKLLSSLSHRRGGNLPRPFSLLSVGLKKMCWPKMLLSSLLASPSSHPPRVS